MDLRLIKPSLEALASYRSALERGWSPDTLSDAAIGRELAAIAEDPVKFISLMDDPDARGEAAKNCGGASICPPVL